MIYYYTYSAWYDIMGCSMQSITCRKTDKECYLRQRFDAYKGISTTQRGVQLHNWWGCVYQQPVFTSDSKLACYISSGWSHHCEHWLQSQLFQCHCVYILDSCQAFILPKSSHVLPESLCTFTRSNPPNSECRPCTPDHLHTSLCWAVIDYMYVCNSLTWLVHHYPPHAYPLYIKPL